MIFKLYDLTEAKVLNIKYLRHQKGGLETIRVSIKWFLQSVVIGTEKEYKIHTFQHIRLSVRGGGEGIVHMENLKNTNVKICI